MSHSQCDLEHGVVTQTNPDSSVLKPISQQSPNRVEMCFLDKDLEPSTGSRPKEPGKEPATSGKVSG